MAIDSESGLIKAFEMLADMDVSIINFSGGFPEYTTAYSNINRQIDKLICESGITFVTSAGNSETSGVCVTSPGKAYNAITVGNAFTKGSSEMDSELLIPYDINPTSSYAEKDYLSNKPDIVAPGTNIICNLPETGISIAEGSSLSAAVVTGVVAQLQQCSPLLKVKPSITKAVLLAGADRDIVYDDYNNSRLLGEKAGAGIVNATRSIEILLADHAQHLTFLLSRSVPSVKETEITLRAGEKAKIVMTYNKPEDYIITEKYADNVNLYLYDANGTRVAYSMSTVNNVEVIEYTPTMSGTYTVRSTLESKDAASNDYLFGCVAWNISDKTCTSYIRCKGRHLQLKQ